jgi:ABC-type lipoprotein export system ATPase subunit
LSGRQTALLGERGLDTALLACRGVSVVYGSAEARVEALRDVDVAVEPHERLALWGPSGSGKTTLLHVLGGLVAPTRGGVVLRGERLPPLGEAARGRAGIAFVFQGANLLPHFTAFENVAFAAEANPSADTGHRPEVLLELVGLGEKLDHLPSELSGGESQRVAIARALGQSPELLLCDEPTGQLDSDTGRRVLDLIDALQAEFGFALVVATHDADVTTRYDRVLTLSDGTVIQEVTP